jgi:hypothetical protein
MESVKWVFNGQAATRISGHIVDALFMTIRFCNRGAKEPPIRGQPEVHDYP